MDTKTILIYGFAVFFAIIKIALTAESKVDLSLDNELSMQKRLDPSQDAVDSYDFTDEDLVQLMKRGSLLRFGKRGSLLRFGKRGSILRFGKRSSLLRFGKRFGHQDDNGAWQTYLDEDLKRNSILRFGKKAALFRYGRSAEKAPHTPFRFGREEELI
ncbi:FMRFamide-like neuropeptides 7 [Mytilus edulis]|uniref:FMRFamide-like neuropeptides 7 n=1 Tax=Mytilus edulis TaxID=6550 RepID=UPI0039EEF4EC